MIIGVPKETFPGERRVALTPDVLSILKRSNLEVRIEAGAGVKAGYSEEKYIAKGASIIDSRRELFASTDVILQVRSFGANLSAGKADIELLRAGQTVIGLMEPLSEIQTVKELARTGIDLFSMELMPRITRAQSMDVLSSMATIAGYKAVLMAADTLPRMFPMSMTAAGTITPAKLFVIGAGVAGLQAIATARRLGAVVKGYDIRPAVKEQVESLGARFVEMELDSQTAEDKGGYAKAMDEEFYRRQRELMTKVIAESDVVITTAAVPGRKAPTLVTRDMVEQMTPGSVIVDLAAEQGGNCELTKADETVEVNGVTILGPLNIPSMIPYHASQMHSRNITTFLTHLVKEDKLTLDMEDEITRETLLTHDGRVVHPRVLELLAETAEASNNGSNE